MNYDPDKWPCTPPAAILEPNEYDPCNVVSLINALAMIQTDHPEVFTQIIAEATKKPADPKIITDQ